MDGQKAGYISGEELAAIQYCGIAGATSDCLDAIIRFIHCGDQINIAKLLSCPSGETSKAHAFILDINHGDIVGIKSGFGSGYSGRGSYGLVQALKVLLQCGGQPPIESPGFKLQSRRCVGIKEGAGAVAEAPSFMRASGAGGLYPSDVCGRM